MPTHLSLKAMRTLLLVQSTDIAAAVSLGSRRDT